MRRTLRTRRAVFLSVFAAAAVAVGREFTPEAYRNPPPECSAAFFWMWNAKLDVDKLCAQLDEMAENGLRNVCIHPFPAEFRPGKFSSEMSPKYLSPEYVKVYGKVVEHAKELGMHVWLYDEGGWPSGGAAGLVAASDTEGRFRPRYVGNGRSGKEPLHIWTEPYGPGVKSYPSMIEKGATERFIALTHERLAVRLGDRLGSTMKFVFMDEPEVRQTYWFPMLAWTEDFAAEFKARKGYDITPYLQDVIDSRYRLEGAAVERRLDYKDVLADLFVERYMLPIRDWCRAHGMLSGGHFSGEDEPESACRYGYGALLRSLRALDVPGIDVIWRQIWPAKESGLGRQAPFPRYAASASHYNGGRYVLSESFGIFGDSLTPMEMKWLCDYQMVRGCNTFVFGYEAVSTEGQWMALFEPHLGPVSPMWGHLKPFYEYLHRTCGMLSRGKSAAETVVFYDQRAFWTGGDVATTATDLQLAVAAALDRRNTDFDFADDEVFEKAKIDGAALCCGAATYRTVVVPAWGKMTARARAKLTAFAAAGGRVVTAAEVADVPRTCGVSGPLQENVRVAKRVSGDQSLYFLVNESVKWTDVLRISFTERGPISYCDPETGRFVAVDATDGSFDWKFAPCGSALFVVGAKPEVPAKMDVVYSDAKPVVLKDGWTLQPLIRHVVGKRDLERNVIDAEPKPTTLGDWRGELGSSFSGKAVYRIMFDADGGRHRLNLGRVGWAASATLNGVELMAKAVGPFAWDVELKKGVNTLEVTVANTLANALAEPGVRDRIARDFPPASSYGEKLARYDHDNGESGLIGPVTLKELK